MGPHPQSGFVANRDDCGPAIMGGTLPASGTIVGAGMSIPPVPDEPIFAGGATFVSIAVRDPATTSSARRQLPCPIVGEDIELAGTSCEIVSGAAPRTIGRSPSAVRVNDTGWTFVPPEAITWGRPKVATGGGDTAAWVEVCGFAGRETAMAIGWAALTSDAWLGRAGVERQTAS